MTIITEAEKSRFTIKWVEIDTCHIWQGSLDKDGYGSFYFRKKNRRAHRFAYYMVYGDIPDDMVIDHICKKRSCVNPNHLELVTWKENAIRGNGIGAVNARKTKCKNGHLFDKQYGKQRYCSICNNAKRTRLAKKWREEANSVKC